MLIGFKPPRLLTYVLLGDPANVVLSYKLFVFNTIVIIDFWLNSAKIGNRYMYIFNAKNKNFRCFVFVINTHSRMENTLQPVRAPTKQSKFRKH